MSTGVLPSAPAAGSGCGALVSEASRKLFPGKGSVGFWQRTVSNGSRIRCMKTWNPINNKKFETFSYLPPVSEDSIAKEVEYMLSKGWIPCLEFDEASSTARLRSRGGPSSSHGGKGYWRCFFFHRRRYIQTSISCDRHRNRTANKTHLDAAPKASNFRVHPLALSGDLRRRRRRLPPSATSSPGRCACSVRPAEG